MFIDLSCRYSLNENSRCLPGIPYNRMHGAAKERFFNTGFCPYCSSWRVIRTMVVSVEEAARIKRREQVSFRREKVDTKNRVSVLAKISQSA